MDPFRKLIQEAEFFDGEVEAILAEVGGQFAVGLAQLPIHRRERVTQWLGFPLEARWAAYTSAREWAVKPIAAALDALKNPGKSAAPIKPPEAPQAPSKPRDYTWW